MLARLKSLSIRRRIVLFVLVILLPLAGLLAWFVGSDLRQARAAADDKVLILSTDAATLLKVKLAQAETILAMVAERPLLRALDPSRCEPIVVDFNPLNPEYLALDLRDARGNLVCSSMPDRSRPMTPSEMNWFEWAWAEGKFASSGVASGPQTGRKLIALSHPVRNDAGEQIALVVLAVDLLTMNQQLLASTPKDAVVTVADRTRAVLLRSADPETFIGTRPPAGEADPAQGARAGFLSTPGRDGVLRRFAYLTLPGVEWRVAASMPEALLLTAYQRSLHLTLAMGGAVLLLALALAWRVSAAIVQPVNRLADTVTVVALGDTDLRVDAVGPPEVGALAAQFNRMLDARSASDTARREAEARYRTLVDWSPEAVSVHVAGVVRFVNSACVALLRAGSAEELVGRASMSVVGQFERPDALRRVAESLELGIAVPPHEQTMIRSDGTTVTVEVSGVPIVYEGERALLASMRDITLRKRTESALARSEAQLRAIVETATVAIIVVDTDQLIVTANPAASAMFGHGNAEMVGMALDRLIPVRYRESHRNEVRRFGSGGDSSRHMGRFDAVRDVVGLRANGEEFPVDASISHVSVAGQGFDTVILRDISERRRAESALRESEANLRRLLVLLPEAVFVSSGLRISFVNEAAQRLFATDEAALLGRDPLSLIHPDSRALVKSRIDALHSESGGAVPPAQAKIVRADGAVRVVESVAARVGDHGEVAVIVILRDITALVEARQALADSHAELRWLVASKDQVQEDERKRIARELHDDLQQTLAAIRIDLVAAAQRLDTAPQEVPPLLEQTSALAASALESTRRIINDLRPQMLEDLGLIPALEALANQFTRRTGIDCRVREHDDDPSAAPLSAAVTTCLYRVAQEAIGNAAKHARASRVRISVARGADDRVVLRITDNGQGMALGGPRKPESFGLLGMQERVRALGAELHIRSEGGSGTTIEVRVPPAAGAGPRPDEAATDAIARPPSPARPASELLPAVISALDGNVAVLDRQGVILFVNQAWRLFAERGGDPGMLACGPGIDYLDVCRRSMAEEPLAGHALRGLSDVLAGRESSYVLAYPCATPDGLKWFRMHAAAIDANCVVVMHVDLAPPELTPIEEGKST